MPPRTGVWWTTQGVLARGMAKPTGWEALARFAVRWSVRCGSSSPRTGREAPRGGSGMPTWKNGWGKTLMHDTRHLCGSRAGDGVVCSDIVALRGMNPVYPSEFDSQGQMQDDGSIKS